MLRFSPGIAQGCHEFLVLSKKHPNPTHYFLDSFKHFGSIPADKILAVAQALCWIHINEQGNLSPTDKGERLLHIGSYSELLRRMLLDLIEIDRPSWVQNAISGRAKLLGFVGDEIAQVFIEANLVNGIDIDTVAFWDSIASKARGLRDEMHLKVGRIGERLTVEYETRRTGKPVKWISIENNTDGYDVLSTVSDSDARKLSIEVKASTLGLHGYFYITSNEWDRAQETPFHVFHLWDISGKQPSLCVLDAKSIHCHIPKNFGDGEWQNVQIPFSVFKDKFNIK